MNSTLNTIAEAIVHQYVILKFYFIHYLLTLFISPFDSLFSSLSLGRGGGHRMGCRSAKVVLLD